MRADCRPGSSPPRTNERPPPKSGRAALEPIADALAEIDEVSYVVLTAGNFDLLAEVVCESDEHLLELISNRIRGIPGVVGTETLVYLKLAKQTYDEGVRL